MLGIEIAERLIKGFAMPYWLVPEAIASRSKRVLSALMMQSLDVTGGNHDFNGGHAALVICAPAPNL